MEEEIRTVSGLLRYTAAQYGEKPCIRWLERGQDHSRSYRRFYADSSSFSLFLHGKIGRRRHVAVMGKTSYAYLCALNGVFLSGNVAVPLDPNLGTEDAVRLLCDADVDALFYDSAVMPGIMDILSAQPDLCFCFDLRDADEVEAVLSAPAAALPAWEQAEDVSAIIYTSGTTGERKGAMLTSAALISNIFFKEMNFEGDHVALNVLPMHHIFCFSCDYLKNLKDGVTICLNSDVSAVGAELVYFAPTVIRLVPMIADSLLRRVRILRRRDPDLSPRAAAERVFGSRLRNIIVSGAAYSADNEAEFDAMGITVRQGYGMTETGPRIAVPDGGTCAASGGRIISICSVRLQNGEIQVKSPSLMTGYYKRPEETRTVFTEDGWFRTGDLGRITPDRELFITGRLKNVIILSNGENVSPEELERKLRALAPVSEAEVFEDRGVIAAELYLDGDYVARVGETQAQNAARALVTELNASADAAHAIDKVLFRTVPLDKTATGKIKRRKFRL